MYFQIVSIPNCDFCARAISAAKEAGALYVVKTLTEKNKSAFLDKIGAKGKDRTFPRVFEVEGTPLDEIAGSYKSEPVLIGGYEEFASYLMDNMDEFVKPQLDTIFEKSPDARLDFDHREMSDGEKLFRKRYRQLEIDEIDLHDQIKDKASDLANLFYRVAPINEGPVADREKSANVQLAIRHLEDAVYRAVKALTA